MKDRRQEILVTAYGLMGTKGLEEVHARTVAAEIGVNHATVHYYFRTRADLIAGVAEYAQQILLEDRGRFQEGASTAREKIENEIALAEAYCRKQSRFVKVLAGLYVASIADASVRKKVKALWASWLELNAAQLKVARTKRESPYNDPELLMATIFGLGLANHMLDGQLNAAAKLEDVTKSLFG
ncbi:MAG: TetR/AcrR family transcriptional regulator [Armatimonadetes bacterium]|nr:TetR/AcrR family transcriptional regulator [Armatimonadota bacterium]